MKKWLALLLLLFFSCKEEAPRLDSSNWQGVAPCYSVIPDSQTVGRNFVFDTFDLTLPLPVTEGKRIRSIYDPLSRMKGSESRGYYTDSLEQISIQLQTKLRELTQRERLAKRRYPKERKQLRRKLTALLGEKYEGKPSLVFPELKNNPSRPYYDTLVYPRIRVQNQLPFSRSIWSLYNLLQEFSWVKQIEIWDSTATETFTLCPEYNMWGSGADKLFLTVTEDSMYAEWMGHARYIENPETYSPGQSGQFALDEVEGLQKWVVGTISRRYHQESKKKESADFSFLNSAPDSWEPRVLVHIQGGTKIQSNCEETRSSPKRMQEVLNILQGLRFPYAFHYDFNVWTGWRRGFTPDKGLYVIPRPEKDSLSEEHKKWLLSRGIEPTEDFSRPSPQCEKYKRLEKAWLKQHPEVEETYRKMLDKAYARARDGGTPLHKQQLKLKKPIYQAREAIFGCAASLEHPFKRKKRPAKKTRGMKPIIYLYPETSTEVDVQLQVNGEFVYVYPQMKNGGWKVQAHPDGRLVLNGKDYYSLFWEADLNLQPKRPPGFVVERDSLETFFEEKLTHLGLNYKERQEFIVYWAPQMQKAEQYFIHFSFEEYTKVTRLKVTPEPDTQIRFLMMYKPLGDRAQSRSYAGPIQQLPSFKREGFTLVEWGGAKLP